MMRKTVIGILALLCLSTAAFAQKADFRRGNRAFRKENYGQADIDYRKGLLKDSTQVKGRYNLAGNLYRQGSFDEAAKQMEAIPVDSLNVGAFESDVLFNKGDIAIARQDWQTAVNCFIQYLMVHPDDIAAKENYTYARYHLQNQDQNQKQDQDQNKDQNQDQQNQDQDQNQDQNQNQNKDQRQQPQPQPEQLSPQQAQQLLQAIQDKEKQTQEKVDEKKAAVLKSRQKEKNW
jgi:flagellar motor protein MotB